MYYLNYYKWKSERSKSKFRFAIKYGFSYPGMLVLLVLSLLVPFLYELLTNSWKTIDYKELAHIFIIIGITWSILSFVVGLIIWSDNKKLYRNYALKEITKTFSTRDKK